MEFIIEIITNIIFETIIDVIFTSTSTSIENSIKNSISKKLVKKLEGFIEADGKIDEKKINSLIKVNVHKKGSGLYSVSIHEKIFNILDLEMTTTKNTKQLLRLIKKEIVLKKMKAKMRKDMETANIAEALEAGFK